MRNVPRFWIKQKGQRTERKKKISALGYSPSFQTHICHSKIVTKRKELIAWTGRCRQALTKLNGTGENVWVIARIKKLYKYI